MPESQMAEVQLTEADFKKAPTIIVIDVTNSCNLRCPVCPVTISMHRKRGLMKMNVFSKIIDDFKDRPEKPAIYFNFSGEPTMNKALPEMVAYSSTNGHDTFLSTNATKLTEKMAEDLINAGLARVNLCMDGFSDIAQESYRVGSKFNAVKENIEMFLKVRKRMGVKNPECVLQTLLTSYSENQMDEMTAWAKKSGFDKVRYKTFSIGSYTTEEEKAANSKFLPKNEDLLRHPTGRTLETCPLPTYQTVVFWNGDLGLCCLDYDQMVQLPNVEEKGFMQAYTSPEVIAARMKGYYKEFDICKGCSLGNAESMGFKINFDTQASA